MTGQRDSSTTLRSPANGFGEDWVVISPIAAGQQQTYFQRAGAQLVPGIFAAVQESLDFTAEVRKMFQLQQQ